MFKFIPKTINSISEKIAKKTKPFANSKAGELFMLVVLAGPFTFLPTVYQAWTAPNIDALKTLTWPLMIIVNMSALFGVIHSGDWRLRLVMMIWVVMMVATFTATIVR